MSQIATIVVEDYSEKSGVNDKGNPWTNSRIKDENGNWYGTFEKNVVGPESKGQKLEIEWEPNGNFKDLLRASPSDSQSAAPVQSEGKADWDLIGLRKTRCALWAAYFAEAAPLAFEAWRAAQTDDPGTADIVHFLQRVGKQLVVAAEIDIFHRAPAEADEDVPF